MPIKQRTIDFVQDTRLLVARARELERRGATDEALVAYDMAAALIAGLPPGAFHADLYRWKGTLLRDLGETAKADCLLKRSLAVAQYVVYADGVAHGQNALAAVYLRRGDVATARQLYGDASTNAAAAGDQRLYALIEQSLGAIAEIQGDLEGARIRYHMSLRTLRATGDDEGVSWALHRIALAHIQGGRNAEAAQALAQAEEFASARGDRLTEARIALARSLLHLREQRLDDAEREHARASAITERRHERPLRAETLFVGAGLGRARGDLRQAASLLREAAALAALSEDVVTRARTLAELGGVYLESGERESAIEAWHDALAGFTKVGAEREMEMLRLRLSGHSGAENESRSS
jgi:tetratricopeptide (TPR) repeat protein